MNTKKSGKARAVIFKSGKIYRAVCIDFDLFEEADTKDEAEKQIKEAIVGYIKNVCKNDLDDKLLNRHAEKRYWTMYQRCLEKESINKSLKVDNTRSFGVASIFTLPINLVTACSR